MRGTWTLSLGLTLALGCGPQAPVEKPAPTPEPDPVAVPRMAPPQVPPAKPSDDVAEAPLEPPPIAIPHGRLYDGYVVGGLPSEEQFNAALQAGFDSAMSLMANDEDGITDVARYASRIGIRYIKFTVRTNEDLTESMAWQFASTLAMLGTPAIIHSARGERVGAMFALMAFFVDEVSQEEALAIGRAAGMGSLEDQVRSVLVRE